MVILIASDVHPSGLFDWGTTFLETRCALRRLDTRSRPLPVRQPGSRGLSGVEAPGAVQGAAPRRPNARRPSSFSYGPNLPDMTSPHRI